MYRLIAIALLAASSPALAAGPSDRTQADDHARRGVALYEMGRYDAALGEFEQAYLLYPTGSLLYNLAQTHRRLGHCPDALELYRRLLQRYPESPNAATVAELLPELEAACAVKDRPPAGVADSSSLPAVRVAAAEPAPTPAPADAAPTDAAEAAPAAPASRGRIAVAAVGARLAGASAAVAPFGVALQASWRFAPLPVEIGVAASWASYRWANDSYRGSGAVTEAGVTVGRAVGWRGLALRGDAGVGVLHLAGLERGHPLVGDGRRIASGAVTAPELALTIGVERGLGRGLLALGGARLATALGGANLDGTPTTTAAFVGLGYRP